MISMERSMYMAKKKAKKKKKAPEQIQRPKDFLHDDDAGGQHRRAAEKGLFLFRSH